MMFLLTIPVLALAFFSYAYLRLSAGQHYSSEEDRRSSIYVSGIRVMPESGFGYEAKYHHRNIDDSISGMIGGDNLLIGVSDSVYLFGGASFGLEGVFTGRRWPDPRLNNRLTGNDGYEDNVFISFEGGRKRYVLNEGENDLLQLEPFCQVLLSFWGLLLI